jgi:hypothetical protein
LSVSPYSLTTLAAVYAYSGIASGNDAVLEPIIDGVSAEIERVTARRFVARDYRWFLNGARQARLLLPVRPVQHVTRVAHGDGNALTLSYSGSAIDATATVYDDPEARPAGGCGSSACRRRGTETVNTFAFANLQDRLHAGRGGDLTCCPAGSRRRRWWTCGRWSCGRCRRTPSPRRPT